MSVNPKIQGRGLRPAKVAEKLDIGLSTLWKKAKDDPAFPKPIKLAARTTIFLENEIDEYLAALAAKSRAA
jgi:prophage regulatory protein